MNAGEEAQRWGTAHASIVPYSAFKTKTGYLTVGTGSDAQFVSLCEKLGVPDVANNPKFVNNKLRVQHRAELDQLLTTILETKSNDEWMDIFEKVPFPVGPINNMQEVFNDPHIKEIGIVKTLRHKKAGYIKVVGPPVVYSYSANTARTAPPVLGQHTDEVLRDILGYDEKFINHLRAEKIIQ